MTEFSIADCMKYLNIENGSHLDKLQLLYCHLDKLIDKYRKNLDECIFREAYKDIENFDREVWCGILLRALKMGIESELGGAVKQEHKQVDEILFKIGLERDNIAGRISWVSCPEYNYTFMLKILTPEQKSEIQEAFSLKQNNVIYPFNQKNKDWTDKYRQFEIENDLMDLDRSSVSDKTSFLQGVNMNIELAYLDDDMCDTLKNEWISYQKMSPTERVVSFRKFLDEIRYVNGYMPRPIHRNNNDNSCNDNINQRN